MHNHLVPRYPSIMIHDTRASGSVFMRQHAPWQMACNGWAGTDCLAALYHVQALTWCTVHSRMWPAMALSSACCTKAACAPVPGRHHGSHSGQHYRSAPVQP